MEIFTKSDSKNRKQAYLWQILTSVIIIILSITTISYADTKLDLLLLPAEPCCARSKTILMDVTNVKGRMVAVGERGCILYSEPCTDPLQREWSQGNVPVSVTLTAVDFPTLLTGWAIGHDGVVLKTENGGKNWSKQIDGKQIDSMMKATFNQMLSQKNEKLEIATEQNDNQKMDLIASEIESIEFLLGDVEISEKDGSSKPLMDLWFKNDQEGIVIGAFGMILRTVNGGNTWEPLNDRINNPEGYHFYGITQLSDSLFIVGESGILFRSYDWGESWEALDSPYEGSFFGIIGNPDKNLLILFGLRGHIFYSTDKGENWTATASKNKASVFGGCILDNNSICLVSGDGSILRSNDDGHSFYKLSKSAPGAMSLIEQIPNQLVVTGLRGITTLSTDK